MQIATELEIIGRIGKDDIDGIIRQALQSGNAITFDNGVEPGGTRGLDGQLMGKTY
jgi:hypothetical protein